MELSDLPVCPHCDDVMCCCASTRRTRERFRQLGADMYKAREDAVLAVFRNAASGFPRVLSVDSLEWMRQNFVKEPQ